MKLRPHHLLDIVCSYGHGEDFQPHPYGHAVHTVAKAVLADLETEVQFVVGADDICAPCTHLRDGQCDDLVRSVSPPVRKQQYNDELDRRLLQYFQLPPHRAMTVREFLEIVQSKLPGLAALCAHPSETAAHRLTGLAEGLRRLGLGPS